jgi:hypothetical protein
MTDTEAVQAVARAINYVDGIYPDHQALTKAIAQAAIAAYEAHLEGQGLVVVPREPKPVPPPHPPPPTGKGLFQLGSDGKWFKHD